MKPPRVSGRRSRSSSPESWKRKPASSGGKEEGKFLSAPFRPQNVDKSRPGIRNGSKLKSLEGPLAPPLRMIAVRPRLVERRRGLLSVDAKSSHVFKETAQVVAFAEAVAAVRGPSGDRARVEGRRRESGRWASGASPGNCGASHWKHSISAENGMRPESCGRKRPERTRGLRRSRYCAANDPLLDELVHAAGKLRRNPLKRLDRGRETGRHPNLGPWVPTAAPGVTTTHSAVTANLALLVVNGGQATLHDVIPANAGIQSRCAEKLSAAPLSPGEAGCPPARA
jgi:hypothetical protein